MRWSRRHLILGQAGGLRDRARPRCLLRRSTCHRSDGDGHVRLGLSVLVPRDAPCTSGGHIGSLSSEASSLEDRPMLNLTVRNGTSWTPPAPTLVQPNDVVLWNQSGPGLPTPVETVTLLASGWPTNLTRAEVRLSNASDFSGMGVGMRPWTWDLGYQCERLRPHIGDLLRFHRAGIRPRERHRCGVSLADAVHRGPSHRVPGPLPLDSAFLMVMEPDDGTANYTAITPGGSMFARGSSSSTLTGRSRTAPPSSTTASIRPWTSVRTVPGPDKLTASSPSISGITGSRMR